MLITCKRSAALFGRVCVYNAFASSSTVEPINFLTPLEDVTLNKLGLKAEFSCTISKAGLKATWFKGDTKIKRGDDVTITSSEKVTFQR